MEPQKINLSILLNDSIIITEREYFPILFRLKTKEANLRFKLMSEKDVLDALSFSYAKDPTPLLLKEGYSYSDAKSWLNLLRIVEEEKNEAADHLRDLLSSDFLQDNPLGLVRFKKAKVILFEENNNLELQSFLKRKGFDFTLLTFDDLSLDLAHPDLRKSHPDIYLFQNKFQQYMYLFSDLRKRLLDDSSNQGRYQIHIKDDGDLFYLSWCASLFGIEISYQDETALISDHDVAIAISDFYKKQSIHALDGEMSLSLQKLNELIQFYSLNSMPFDRGYANLIEILSSISARDLSSNKGIRVTKEFVFDPDALIYVTDYCSDTFYHVFSDNSVVDDNALLEAGLNPSYVKTKMDRDKKQNYLRYNNILFLSRVKEHLSDAIYDSPFNEEFGWKDDVVEKSVNKDGVYTSEAKEMMMAELLDSKFYPFGFSQYHSYSHAFKGLKSWDPTHPRPWSVTNLESYISCPFKYYLTWVIPSKDGDFHAAYLGTLIHKVFEHVYSDTFDYDKAFSEGIEAYKEHMSRNGQVPGPKEELIWDLSKYSLRKIIHVTNTWKKASSISKELGEVTVNWDLSNGEKTYHFSGRIDKIVAFSSQERSYYALIDYKSGAETFDDSVLFLGRSTQLPLYVYAMENGEKNKWVGDATFGGLGIQHVYFPSFSKGAGKNGVLRGDLLLSNTSIDGFYREDETFYQLADRSAQADKGGKFSGTYLKNQKQPHFVYLPDDQGESLNQLIEEALVGTLNTLSKIEAGEFPIAPAPMDLKKADEKDADRTCDFCPYFDICYHDKNDAKVYKKAIRRHFLGGDEDGEI